jgi:hypothetical protein
MHGEEPVETSDAEEQEEIRASRYVYWKEDAKHETSDRSDDHLPNKRLKVSKSSRRLALAVLHVCLDGPRI